MGNGREKAGGVIDLNFLQIIFVYLPYLSIKNPRSEPRIKFIIKIGIKLIGSCQPIITARGKNSIREIKIPFRAPFNLMSVVVIKNPATIQKIKAEILASQVNFWIIIGIISIIPAINPSTIPNLIFSIF